MLKVQNHILHNKNTNLYLQLAFSKLKNNLLQANINHVPSLPFSQIEAPNIKNKALYLDYIEQVLKNKQLDMLKLENQLTQKQNKLYKQQFKRGVGQIIQQMQQLNNMEKRLKSIQGKMGIRDEEYLGIYRKFQAQSAKSKNQMQEAFKKQYTDLIDQRRALRNKLNQFAELQSYEKYLNQLHDALQAKSQQLAQRESILSQQQTQAQIQQQFQFDSNKLTLQSNASNRKRIKIFNTKPHYPPSQQSNNQHSNQQHSNQIIRFDNNQTFAKQNSYQNYRNQNCQNYMSHINNSSAILDQNSKNDVYDREIYESRGDSKIKIVNNYSLQNYIYKQCKTADTSVQVSSQTIADTEQRLKKQAIMLKFAKKWMKHTFDSNNTKISKKKLMAIHLWKMNTCFDEKISQNAVKSIQALQRVWRKQQKLLYSSKMFPYNQLSLKRKKYVQLMFDLQQKIIYRKRVGNLLKSILTQRHRKQRLIFYYYFCKFFKNSFNPSKMLKGYNQRNKFGQTLGTQLGTGNPSHSHVISTLSSQVLNQQRINLPHKKSTSSLLNNSQKSQPLSKQPSTKKIGKQNNAQKKKNEQQIQKIKQTLAQKQRIQRLLATQCVKLEGLIKICVILTGSCFRTNNYAINKIKETEYTDKLKNLSSQLKGLQFKFQIVMAKCKLGLANNSNKLSTLENLLDFTNLIK